ncbi:MAG: response regulator [gamma proteobacterium symbiont of Bathyaustriella thionipta]|nr:response regulator [gamma proteobacterium symbiont of Bathyaustriella thionipta]
MWFFRNWFKKKAAKVEQPAEPDTESEEVARKAKKKKTVKAPVIEKREQTVLVVDDSRTQLASMCRCLEAAGFDTLTAMNGKEGIIAARKNLPHAIVMDIIMPEINGFKATRYLSHHDETKHIPIVIVSGSDQDSDRVWGLKLGAREFLRKPVSSKELIMVVNRMLEKADESLTA